MTRYTIAFVCIGNSCRSQMAEGWAKTTARDIFEVYSAGTEPAELVNFNAAEVMLEEGIDISLQYPKTLAEIPQAVDILITMGCQVDCPSVKHKYHEDWGLDDPVGKSMAEFRVIRDEIKVKLDSLIEKLPKIIS